MKIEPLIDFVMVVEEEAANKQGEIWIPDDVVKWATNVTVATVIAAGPGEWRAGAGFVKMELQPGDKIFYDNKTVKFTMENVKVSEEPEIIATVHFLKPYNVIGKIEL